MENDEYEEEKYIDGNINYNENVFKIGDKQKEKSICKILTDNGHGTGFLCKIPFGSKNNLLPVLITNNHVINENYIYDVREILFIREIDSSYLYNISFGVQRRFYTNEKYDFTIIEIKFEDNLDLNSFLEVDDCLDFEYPYLAYENLEVYTIHFPLENKVTLCQGIIVTINKDNKIYHKCSTDKGSSGCPIINAKNFKVIGIHKGSDKDKNKNLNVGTFIKFAIDKFNEEMIIQGNEFFENYFDGIKILVIEYEIINPNEKLKLFGEKFVENNKNKCKIYIKDYEYDLCAFFDIKEYNYKTGDKFKIQLGGVNNIIDMSYIFYKCKNLKSVPNISQLNTSNIINMNRLFEGCELLETLPDISGWDIGKVTDIRGMFFNCKNLKKLADISGWNTINVTTMKDMFWSCSKLSHKYLPDIRKWDTRNAIDAKDVFDGYEYGKDKNLGHLIINRMVKALDIRNYI